MNRILSLAPAVLALGSLISAQALAAPPLAAPKGDWVRPGEFKGKKILLAVYYWEGATDNAVPMNHVPPVLERMGFKVDIARAPEHLPDLAPYDELWVVSGSGSTFDTSDAERVGRFLGAGHGVYVMADNIPYVHEAKVIGKALHGIDFDGDYYGGKPIHVVGSGAVKKMVDEAMKKGDFEKLAELRRAGFLNGKLYAEDHELLTGIREIYEGITVAHMTGAPDLEVILRASDNQALVSVSHNPKQLIVYDGGFTRLYCGWETNAETSTRWYQNVAAYLLGKKRADLAGSS
jgi:hypothetical protein